MLIYICLLLTVVGCSVGDAGDSDEVTDGTTLKLAFVVFRHGDRTPVPKTVPLCTDPEACLAASEPFGLGQLTDVGKRRAYALGLYIRRRYNSLISSKYNASEIYIRSTDTTRTKMTVLTAMAAVYPAYYGSWSKRINWVPVPYKTVPELYDYNRPTVNCPTVMKDIAAKKKAYQPRMAKYSKVLNYIAEVSNNSLLAEYPIEAYGVHDAYVSQVSLGVKLDPKIAAVMSGSLGLSAAAGVAMDIRFGDSKTLPLNAGPLLSLFFTQSGYVMNGIPTQKLWLISAHDGPVYSIAAICRAVLQEVPGYCASITLELRNFDGTDEYGVLVVYVPSPGEKPKYLRIKGCGDTYICPIDTFLSIVSKDLLDEDTWRDLCGWYKDLKIDETG